MDALLSLIPPQYLVYLPIAVAVCSAICAVTTTPDPSTAWGKVYRVLEFIALNFGKSKQLPPTSSPKPSDAPTNKVPVILLAGALGVSICLGACAKGTGNDLAVNSYRTLAAAGITYDAAMKGLSDAYDRGILDEEGKNQAIEAANLFWASYHAAVMALEEYVTLGSSPDASATAKITTVIADMIGKLDKLRAIANVIMPKLGLQGV